MLDPDDVWVLQLVQNVCLGLHRLDHFRRAPFLFQNFQGEGFSGWLKDGLVNDAEGALSDALLEVVEFVLVLVGVPAVHLGIEVVENAIEDGFLLCVAFEF